MTVPHVCLRHIGSNLAHPISQLAMYLYRLQRFLLTRTARRDEQVGVGAKEDSCKYCPAGAFIQRVSAVSRLGTCNDPFFVGHVNCFPWSQCGFETRPRLPIREGTALYGYYVDGDDRSRSAYHRQTIVVLRLPKQDVTQARALGDDQAGHAIARDRQSSEDKDGWFEIRRSCIVFHFRRFLGRGQCAVRVRWVGKVVLFFFPATSLPGSSQWQLQVRLTHKTELTGIRDAGARTTNRRIDATGPVRSAGSPG